MKFTTILDFPIALLISFSFHQAAHTLYLSGRARFNGLGQPQVGPPNPRPRCDMSGKYGSPSTADCEQATHWISGTAARIANNLANGRPFNWDMEGYYRVNLAIVEFVSERGERQNTQRPAMRTPKFWRYGDCVVMVGVYERFSRWSSDEAAWKDVKDSALETIEECVEGQGSGGYQFIGERNAVAVEIFGTDSEYCEELETHLGHELPSLPLGDPTAPTQHDYIDDGASDDDDGEESMCFSGASAGWSLDASKCCPGYKFVLQIFENVYQLLGISPVSAASVGTCS